MAAKHKAQAPDRRRQKPRLGPRRGEGAPHPGRGAHQAPGCLSCWGGEGTKRRRNRVPAFVEDPKTGTARNAGPAPYRAAGSLSSVDGEAAPLPPRSAMELANLNIDHLRPPVSERKLGTEEAGKQKPNKQREPLQKGPVQQIKIPVGNTDYTGRGL